MNDQPDGGSLRAANGSNIQTYGEKLLTLNIGLRRDFTFVFIVADGLRGRSQLTFTIQGGWVVKNLENL